MPPKTLLVRADATLATATGHVMRCLALAQAWQDVGGRVVFVMAEGSPAVRSRLQVEGIEVVQAVDPPGSANDAKHLTKLARRYEAHWVVVDGYHFRAGYQHDLKAAGLKVLFLDDYGHAGHYSADLVLNQNAHADENFYRHREAHTRLLLGPRYIMLRREFEGWREWKREIAPIGRRVLVTMGGSDPDNVTERAIQALKLVRVEKMEVTVVVGGSNPHFDSLQKATAAFTGTIRLQRDVSNMPELMAWADVAVSAAGGTCWEMCLLGLPAILIDLAENQRPIAEELARKGCAFHVGGAGQLQAGTIASKLEWLLSAATERGALSRRARGLVDSKGAKRVVSAVLTENLDQPCSIAQKQA